MSVPFAPPPSPTRPAVSPPGARRLNPWPFMITLPLVSALPNATSLGMATLYYKSLGFSNAFIGYTGALFVPFAAAFLWAPWVDRFGTKRGWQLGLTFALAVAFAGLAGTVALRPASPWPTLGAITLIAFVGATADVAMNGFFLHALDARQQAASSGFRVAAIRCGHILAGGVLLKLCADYGARGGDANRGWVALFVAMAGVFLVSLAYHAWALPRPETDRPARVTRDAGSYRRVLQELRALPRLPVIVAFYLVYRFGEGLLARMISPFLLDARAVGGMGLSVGDVAVAQGVIGAVAAISGGILGGWVIKVFGLRRTMAPLALCMTAPHVCYLLLAASPPAAAWQLDFAPLLHRLGAQGAAVWSFNPGVVACIAVEAFGYGMGFASMFTLTMVISRGEFRSTIAAVFAALWAVGWLVPTILSGVIQSHIGYFGLFALSIATALPGVLLAAFLPLREIEAAAEMT